MTNFFRRLSREKLYKQWVENEGLSPEDLPEDLKKGAGDSMETDENSIGKESPRSLFGLKTGQRVEGMFTFVSFRLILIMAIIIMVLLVALAVVLTVLVMR